MRNWLPPLALGVALLLLQSGEGRTVPRLPGIARASAAEPVRRCRPGYQKTLTGCVRRRWSWFWWD
jgi:hypothetical protein